MRTPKLGEYCFDRTQRTGYPTLYRVASIHEHDLVTVERIGHFNGPRLEGFSNRRDESIRTLSDLKAVNGQGSVLS